MADSYQKVHAKYSTATTIYFPLITAGANTFKSGAAMGAGNTLISIDGGGAVNSTNNPTEIGATGVYTLALTAGEVTGLNIMVIMKKGGTIEDRLVQVKTSLDLGTLNIDASQYAATAAVSVTAGASANAVNVLGGATTGDAMQLTAQNGNSNGLKLSAAGTGYALRADTGNILGVLLSMSANTGTAQSGSPTQIQLAATAVATDNYYNSGIVLIIGGTGAGQFNSITTYTGATRLCTMANTWATSPNNTSLYVVIPGQVSNFVASSVWTVSEGPQPSGPPPDNSTFGQILQYLKRFYYNKATQTTAARTFYQDDSATVLTTQSTAFDGITQTRGKGA